MMKDRMKLIYADTYSVKNFHETFNASMLKVLSGLYTDVTYRARKDTKRCLEEHLGGLPENVRYEPVMIYGGGGTIGLTLKYLSSMLWNIWLVMRQREDEVLYFSYNTVWGLGVINWLVKRRHRSVIVQWHGELECALNGKLNPISTWRLRQFAKDNWSVASDLYFSVLGDSILRNVADHVAAKHMRQFVSMNHSFIAHDVKSEVRNVDGVYRIGMVGTVHEMKGLDNIVAMGRALNGRKDMEFYVIGRVMCDVRLLEENGVRYIPGAEHRFLEKETMDRYIGLMDCLVFTYPEDGYKLTASGALFDAVDHEKVVLSLHNDYFDDMYRRADLGCQFESLDEMIDFVVKRGAERLAVDTAANKRRLGVDGVRDEVEEVLRQKNLL